MGIVTWVLVGLVLGVVASFVGGKNNTIANVVIGLVGAGLAGWVASFFFGVGTIAAFNVWNLLISAAGAVVLLLIFMLTQRNSEA